MVKSRNLLDSFCSFAVFNSEGFFQKWQQDGQLQHHMNAYLKQRPVEESIEAWSLFWHQDWQPSQLLLPQQHLLSYLQTPALQIAYSCWTKHQVVFPDFMPWNYFCLCLFKVTKILETFQPHQGISLAAYAYRVFERTITDEFRRSSAASGHSDWGLLSRTSVKYAQEALLTVLPSTQIDNHLKVLECYQDLTAPSHPRQGKKLTEPPPEVWEKIVTAYGRDRPPQYQETLQTYLQTIVKAVRGFSHAPRIQSLNQSMGEDQSVEPIDLVADEQALPLEQLAQRDRIEQLQSILGQAVEALLHPTEPRSPKQQQKATEIAQILPIFYGEQCSQTEVGQRTKISQDIVCRRLSDAKQSIWMVLQSHFDNLDFPLIKDYSRLLDLWLYQYFASFATHQEPENNEYCSVL